VSTAKKVEAWIDLFLGVELDEWQRGTLHRLFDADQKPVSGSGKNEIRWTDSETRCGYRYAPAGGKPWKCVKSADSNDHPKFQGLDIHSDDAGHSWTERGIFSIH
jgi:hypothetical protein